MDNKVEGVKREYSGSKSAGRAGGRWESLVVSFLYLGRAASGRTRGPRTVPVLAMGRQHPVRGHMSVTRRTERGTIFNIKKGGGDAERDPRTRLDWRGRETSVMLCAAQMCTEIQLLNTPVP